MRKLSIVIVLIVLALASCTVVPEAEVYTMNNEVIVTNKAGGVAVQGYDVVAYFPAPIGQGKAVRGDSSITASYGGVPYHFSSEANRDRFAADPKKYAPQYGGYCAWAVSRGYKAGIVPKAFTVHNGRLFLNFSRSVQRQFDADLGKNIQRADANWPSVRAGIINGN